MSEVSAEQQSSTESEESRAIQFLQENPSILMDYPDVLASLSIPHQTGGATSLLERQLRLLREENQYFRAKIEELVEIARDNEELNQRFHRLALELMDSEQLHDVLAMVQDQVQTFFYTDFVCFRFLPGIHEAGNTLEGLYLDANSKTGDLCGVRRIPETLVYDPKGFMAHQARGSVNWKSPSMAAQINRAKGGVDEIH